MHAPFDRAVAARVVLAELCEAEHGHRGRAHDLRHDARAAVPERAVVGVPVLADVTRREAADVLNAVQMGIESKDLFGKAILSTSSCLGPCSIGPVIVVYPDGVWYNKVKPEDVNEILDSHIVNGKKVDRLEIDDSLWG